MYSENVRYGPCIIPCLHVALFVVLLKLSTGEALFGNPMLLILTITKLDFLNFRS